MAVAACLLATIAVLFLSGCDLPADQATQEPGSPTDTPSPQEPEVTTQPPEEGTLTEPAVITLTLWTTEAFSPTETITSGRMLAQQVSRWETFQPDIRIAFVPKKPYGKGGILDYLLSTQAVVPELLPDLVVIDIEELGAAAEAEVVQPLDDLLAAEITSDLYPFARQACTFDGLLYGLQYQADLEHTVYNAAQQSVAPSSWPGVLSSSGPFLFPAGGQGGLANDAFVNQYLAVRDWPSDGEPDGPFLQVDSLAAVLQYYQDGISRGVFPAEALSYHTTDACWQDFVAGEAMMTYVSAHRFLSDRDKQPGWTAAPIPGINGPVPALVRGWAMALVTTDPARQSAALEFMSAWLAPEANAAWNLAADYLPTRQAALAMWNTNDSYVPFIQQQLTSARPRPRLSNYARVTAAMQLAIGKTFDGALTPEEAAVEAVESIP